MRAFFDTSALVKKYILEDGWEKFDGLLNKVTAIVVAPVYFLEMNGMVQRKLTERSITARQANLIKQNVENDLEEFEKIAWDASLEQTALTIIEKYPIKTLDSIQLASAFLSKAKTFITSDRKLFHIAKKELKGAVLI